MPQNTYLTLGEQEKIYDLHVKGKSLRLIASAVNRSYTCVRNFLKAPYRYGKAILRSGRKSKINQREKRSICRKVRDKKISLRRVESELNKKISRSTIHRIILESNLSYQKLKRGPALSEEHKLRRKMFAKELLLKGRERLNEIIFSDEKRFTLTGPDGFRGYWKDLRSKPQYFSRKLYSPGVMVWGCIGEAGTLSLEFVSGTINSLKYQEILNTCLLPHFNKTKHIFQQDNARPHASKSTIEWLNENNVKVLEWPPYSPDINLIENVWAEMAKKVYCDSITYESIDNLKAAIRQSWSSISYDLIKSLYESLPERLFQIVSCNGGFLP